MHERLRDAAAEHAPDDAIEMAVTDIETKAGAAGGAKLVDEFRVLNNKIIDEQLKPYTSGAKASGALYMPEKTKGCVLVPPLACRFEMQRGGERPRRLLRVFGHVATVDALGGRERCGGQSGGGCERRRARRLALRA